MRHLIPILVFVLIVTLAPAASAAGGLQQDSPPLPGSLWEATPWIETGPEAVQPGSDAPAANIVPWARMVFQSYRDNNWEIYGANPDGSGAVRLTNHPALDKDARLNRGATRIVFASDRAGGDFDIFAMNADGSGVTALTNDSTDDQAPAWSPDGARVVFESYRHGIDNAEVYVMNGNGSGQTRLTNSPGYDGTPSYSPDGSKIAFVSNRNGPYRIMVMNADGSGQQVLSNQQNAFDPVWSPDGRQIAYDADYDGDNWEELWLMNADGSNQHMIYNPSGDVVAWARSWSPDGRYLAFSEIALVYYQGNWYWTTGHVRVWDSANPSSVQDMTPGDREWKPDLETVDAIAPTSTVQGLPAQSPGPFTVRWSGTDTGGAGLKDYDVQVKDGANGAWTNWLAGTTAGNASYPGIGGHTYYFRSRARDNAFNTEAWPASYDAMTTVESLPPQTGVNTLPEYSRNGLEVRWGGVDPGGSGIKSYDVQTRQDNGSWTNWKTNTTDTAATFSGPAGSTIRFRVRARDNAQNLEAWPSSPDATTVLYTWGISGRVTDNRGAPVQGMAVTTAPAAFHVSSSDSDGAYAAHVATDAASYAVTWSKSGYGSLPSTSFPRLADASATVVLLPDDNIVANWGFESGSLAPNWQAAGQPLPQPVTTAFHSGAWAVRLGQTQSFAALAQLSQDNGQLEQLALGPDDRTHIVWVEHNHIFYANRASSEDWSQPQDLSDSGATLSWEPRLVVQSDGVVHVLWTEQGQGINYRRRNVDGSWSATETIPLSPVSYYLGIDLAVDRMGNAHAVWSTSGTGGTDIFYSMRSPTGQWSAQPRVFSTPHNSITPRLVAASNGFLHLLWSELQDNPAVFYTHRDPGGVWISPRQVSGGRSSSPNVIADPAGGINATWISENSAGQRQMYFHSDGTSDTVQAISPVGYYRFPAVLAVGSSGTLHAVWATGYRQRDANGVWGETETLPIDFDQWSYTIAVDALGTVHVFGYDNPATYFAVYYLKRNTMGTWSAPVEISDDVGDWPPRGYGLSTPTIDSAGNVIAAWDDEHPEPVHVMTAGPDLAQQAGESKLAQSISVPVAMKHPTLSFQANLQGFYQGGSTRFEVQVTHGGSTDVVLTRNTGSNGWAHIWVDLTPWAGQTITVQFSLVQAAGEPYAVTYLDEVSVGSAKPDLWVQAISGEAIPGTQLTRTLAYGNRGGVNAQNANVTLQLPAGLTFVSADPPPSATTPALRWDLGDMPAFSQQTINLTLQVSASAPYGSTLNTTSAITSDTTELETVNNTANGHVFVGSRNWLPLIER